jgi:dihydrofolate reductase
MRKLILEVQMTVDGFVADPSGSTDWQLWNWDTAWNWDDELKKYFLGLMDTVDCILLSRKIAMEGFISHWQQAAENVKDERYSYAKKINETHKVVFTKTLKRSEWDNIDLAKGDLAEEVNHLKKEKGKNIIVYGGATFVSNLIEQNLIDEYQLFINPVAIGEGMKIFNGRTNLALEKSIPFSCGMNVSIYKPLKK